MVRQKLGGLWRFVLRMAGFKAVGARVMQFEML